MTKTARYPEPDSEIGAFFTLMTLLFWYPLSVFFKNNKELLLDNILQSACQPPEYEPPEYEHEESCIIIEDSPTEEEEFFT